MSPSFATPDRTPLNRALVADASLNASPTFPMEICYKNGYFAADPAIEYTPAVVPVEMVVKGIMTEQQYGQGDWGEQIIGVCEARNIIITHRGLYHHGDGLAAIHTSSSGLSGPTPVDTREYIYRIFAPDKDNLVMSCQPVGGGPESVAALTVTDLFAGNPTFHFGYVKDKFYDAVLYDGQNHPGEIYLTAEGVKIMDFRAANEGATDIVYTPLTAAIEEEGNFYIGKLSAVDAAGLSAGFAFELVAGVGDTDNADFIIPAASGNKLYSADEITDGVKYIRVSATDVYGQKYEEALTLTFGVNATPTDIALSDITYVASIMTDDPVADITTTDADPGDTFVYTLVAGDGDTDNAKFQIVGDELQAAVDFVDQVGTLDLRIRATDVGGEYFEKTFAVTVADDILPEMATFTLPETGASYDVTPATVTGTDNVAITHYKITEADVAPAHDAAGWVAAADFTSTAYTIVTQNGTGTYTLYCWAKDAANNVSATSVSDTIDLTI